MTLGFLLIKQRAAGQPAALFCAGSFVVFALSFQLVN
jgi:hypothetical protein